MRMFQQSLTILNYWSVQINNIRLNASECKVLTITRKKAPVIYDYKLGTDSRVGSERISASSLPTGYHENFK